jgi:hypothetical protein
MILRQTVSMANPTELGYDGERDIQEAIPIVCIQKNRLPGVARLAPFPLSILLHILFNG